MNAPADHRPCASATPPAVGAGSSCLLNQVRQAFLERLVAPPRTNAHLQCGTQHIRSTACASRASQGWYTSPPA
jgi:hypothetical protein